MDFFMTPDPYAGEELFHQYKPDPQIIKTRDQDYDKDGLSLFPSQSYLEKYSSTSRHPTGRSQEKFPFSAAKRVRIPKYTRPTTRSVSKSSVRRRRSKSPQTLEKKFSRYLYHPPSYFTKKGKQAKENEIEMYTFEHPNNNSRKLLIPKQGMFSKASRDPTALEKTQIESQMMSQQLQNNIEGPWYPAGTKMDTHHSRVKFSNKKGKKMLNPLRPSDSTKKRKYLGPAKYLTPDYMSLHLNSVKAKNRRNSGAYGGVVTKQFKL